jgi:hypothetical protein
MRDDRQEIHELPCAVPQGTARVGAIETAAKTVDAGTIAMRIDPPRSALARQFATVHSVHSSPCRTTLVNVFR